MLLLGGLAVDIVVNVDSVDGTAILGSDYARMWNFHLIHMFAELASVLEIRPIFPICLFQPQIWLPF